MGIYLNPTNGEYKEAVNKEIYVDKSLLIKHVHHIAIKINKYISVSRPRRFGKSTDANMLVAYYSKGCDSSGIFDNLKISKTEMYKEHLNQYNVIHINMQDFLSMTNNIHDMIDFMSDEIIEELEEEFNIQNKRNILSLYLSKIYAKTKERFIFIIDEWDCIFREYKEDEDAQKIYLDFLRNLLKDKSYVKLTYMTGILPIKKYGSHSALNMFEEISMSDPELIPEFMGFTEKEVQELCSQYDISFEKMKEWYDGYHLTKTISTFSPRSVVASITRKKFGNYWTSTETYEALRIYIDMNFDGLKDDIIRLLAGESISVQTTSFQNDMTTFEMKDDVLTLLVHLGYLGYDNINKKVYIPNKEVVDSFINSIRSSNWENTTKALLNSQTLLEATWKEDEEAVAKYIEEAHLDTSVLTYNNENALSYTISLAYITARNHYTIVRELPSGKGYADIVFIPYKDKPAMIVELKWKQDVITAITQIKNKEYIKALEGYKGDILLVGISYNPDNKSDDYKKHECIIEKVKI